MCGIGAVSLKKGLTQTQRDKVRLNMQILGLYNDSRGGHGCGVYMNSKIYKGHDDDKKKDDTRLIGNFIGQDDWILPKLKSNTMIMHARKATFGLQKEKNNHPFYIETGDPAKDIIGVHNGSLKEVYSLCTKYNLKWADYDVDSEVLLTVIANHGLEVLNEYKGAAALIWTRPMDPDTLYVYHGASRSKKDGEEEEERPMWFLETKEGIYFSSMPESLNAIRDDLSQKVKCFVYNTVFSVKDGKFVENLYTVDRGDVNVETYTYTGGYRNGYNGSGYGSSYTSRGSYTPKKDDPSILDINLETLPYRATKETPKYKKDKTPLVYFHKGRYWYKDNKMHGNFFIDKKGVVFSEDSMQVTEYYFFRGVMLKSKDAYDKVLELSNTDGYSSLNNNALNFAHTISKYSQYPVVMLSHEGTNIDGEWRKSYYLNEKRLVGEFNLNPKWSNRTYHLNDGRLVKISSSIPKEEPKLLVDEKDSKAPTVQLTCISNFDKVFSGIQELTLEISDSEYLAILEYVRQMLQIKSTLDPDDDEIKEFAHKMLRKAVDQKKSIRTMLDDKKRELDVFLALAEELKEEGANKIELSKETEKEEEDEQLDDKTIDEAIEEHEINKLEDEVEGHIEDAIGLVKELHSDAEALETYSGLDIATETADVIKKGVDNIRSGLNEVFDKHNKQALNIELTNI